MTDANVVLGLLPRQPRRRGAAARLAAAPRAPSRRRSPRPLGLDRRGGRARRARRWPTPTWRARSARSPSSAASTRATSRCSPSAAPARCMPATSPRPSASRRVLFPPSPGVFTAMGMLAGRRRAPRVLRALAGRLERARSLRRRRAPRRRCAHAATAALARRGLCAPSAIAFSEAIDLRFEARTPRFAIPLAGLRARRPAARPSSPPTATPTATRPTDAVEAAALRLRAEAPQRRPARLPRAASRSARSSRRAGERPVHFGRGPAVPTPVVARERA